MTKLRLPELVAHADLGTKPEKRRMARALRDPRGVYRAQRSEPVQEAGELLSELRRGLPDRATVLIGFDFPIGLPRAYAAKAGITGFILFLCEIDRGQWPSFFSVANRPEEVSLARPFYPQRPGGAKQRHLLEALGVSEMDQLRRNCELKQRDLPAACPLFWTLGAKQVGKAAISGWREVLLPALREKELRPAIWPFEGQVEELLLEKRVVVVETYPAAFYRHLGVKFRSGSKRIQNDRKTKAVGLLSWASTQGVHIDDGLRGEIECGFGGGIDGEDRFDAVVGLFGMLNVLLGHRPSGEPADEQDIQNVEGWILGMTSA